MKPYPPYLSLLWHLVLFTASLLVSPLSFGNTPSSQDENQPVVNIDTGSGYGSGIILGKTGKDYYVGVTCKHVMKDVADGTFKVGVAGKWVVGNKSHPIPDVDAAYFTFKYNKRLPITQVADEEPPTGDPLYFIGYCEGDGSKFRCQQNATVTDEQVDNGSLRVALTSVRPFEGQSGGGVYNRHGRLVGLIHGYEQFDPRGKAPANNASLFYVPFTQIRRVCAYRWNFYWGVGTPAPVVLNTQPWGYVPCPNGRCRPLYVVPPSQQLQPVQPVYPPSDQVPQPVPDPQLNAPAPPVAPAPPTETTVSLEQVSKLEQRLLALERSQQGNDDIRKLVQQLTAKIDKLPTSDQLATVQSKVDKVAATEFDVQTLTPDGKVFSSDHLKLGDPIQLRLVPKLPAK